MPSPGCGRCHLRSLCRLVVHHAHRSSLIATRRGRPVVYPAASVLLIGLLRVLWRVSYRDMTDWLTAWPALARACGLPDGPDGRPRIPRPAQQGKRQRLAGAVPDALLFGCAVRTAIRQRLMGLRDLIMDSAPVLAWRRDDPDAAYGHAPAHHATALRRGFRVHPVRGRGCLLAGRPRARCPLRASSVGGDCPARSTSSPHRARGCC